MGEIEEYRQTQNDSSDESQEQGNSADPKKKKKGRADDGESVDLGEGLQTYVSVKQEEEVDLGCDKTLMLVNDQPTQVADNEPSDEPDFMKYIKNMNINQISNNYVAGNSIGNQDGLP